MAAMGTATAIKLHTRRPHHMVEGFRSKSMELKWVRRRSTKNRQTKQELSLRPSLFPVYLSTDPTHIDPHQLQALYANCNHSCYRFPNLDSDSRVEPVDIHKLRIALSHSAVLVAVFCKSHHIDDDDVVEGFTSSSSSSNPIVGIAGLVQKVMPVTPFDGQLVGFGRAVSDYGLTATIYDVMVTLCGFAVGSGDKNYMYTGATVICNLSAEPELKRNFATVIPSLRRLGIGQMIVKKIVRMLTNREVYDISALCAGNQRYFFRSCGFGHDLLGSTTMMYTRTTTSTSQGSDHTFTRAGRKLLLIPPLRGSCKSSSDNNAMNQASLHD